VGTNVEGANTGECSDGVDNDEDGFTDCDDTDCANRSNCLGDDDDDTTGDDDDDTVSGDWQLCINEFQASNQATIADGTGAYPDWIELHNLTGSAIDLGGYFITDNLEDTEKHQLAAGLVVPANGFMLLWADGDIDQGDDHLPFSLAKGGEQLGLYDPDGDAINTLEYLPQVTDWSAARFPDGEPGSWDIDTTPTPGDFNGEANDQ
jgi:hypothetical protein